MGNLRILLQGELKNNCFLHNNIIRENVIKIAMGYFRKIIYCPSVILLLIGFCCFYNPVLADSEDISEGLLLSPPKGTIIYDFPVFFDWNDVSGAVGYNIQIDNNSNFSSPTANYEVGYSHYNIYGNAFPDYTIYYWRIRSEYYEDGDYYWGEWTKPWYLIYEEQSTGIDDNNPADSPDEYRIKQNYPNPFNASTTIEYYLPTAGSVTLDIYNILGQKINTIDEGFKKSGYQQITWNGTDYDNNTVASGIYFYRLKAGDYIISKKMQLLK